jgi:hypothetical protein
VKSLLQKNILFYNLSLEYKYKQCFDGANNPIHNSVQGCSWESLIPDKGWELKIKEVDCNLQYPDTNIVLLAFYWQTYELYDSARDLTKTLSGRTYQFNQFYLVGFKKNEPSRICFISGNIFKDRIWSDFKSNGLTIENIAGFLKTKCFNLEIQELHFLKKEGAKFYFSAKLKGFSFMPTLVFNARNQDEVTIKFKHSKLII